MYNFVCRIIFFPASLSDVRSLYVCVSVCFHSKCVSIGILLSICDFADCDQWMLRLNDTRFSFLLAVCYDFLVFVNFNGTEIGILLILVMRYFARFLRLVLLMFAYQHNNILTIFVCARRNPCGNRQRSTSRSRYFYSARWLAPFFCWSLGSL